MHIELEKWIIYGEYKYSNATKYLYDRIDRLPSVTTKQKAEQTDGDLISRQAVENAIAETIVNGESLGYSVAYDILSDLPSVTPQPSAEKTAEWRIVGKTTLHYECSACGGAGDKWDKFCKHCGARIKEGEGE